VAGSGKSPKCTAAVVPSDKMNCAKLIPDSVDSTTEC
jgi:hypothetical protein